MTKSVSLGMGLGAVAGGSVGTLQGDVSGKPNKGTLIGLAIGAAVGGLFGYLKHEDNIKEAASAKNERETRKPLTPPVLSRPEVRRIWIPEKIEGDHYLEGHFMYVIEKPSLWRKN
jgi:hypothetical protein